MKYISHIFLSFLCLSFIACGETGATNNDSSDTATETATPPTKIENKTRPEAPAYKSITRYKTSPTDLEGTLLSKETFNEKGEKIEMISYDYYGSGNEDGRVSFKYDDKGNKVQSFDGKTTETWEYDAENRVLKAAWTRKNGQGASEERFYDEKGNETEVKYYTADGTYDFSRATNYSYNQAGQIIRETKWEKYTDGSGDLQMYDNATEYNADGKKSKSIRYRESGSVMDAEEFSYDGAGNLVESKSLTAEGEVEDRTVNEVNEYGETIKDQTFTGMESLQYTNTYEYNQYGQMINMMYLHEDGDGWGERAVIEYQ